MNKKILVTFLLLTLPFFIFDVLAQVPPPAPNSSVPIQGLGILAALGIFYGVKKLRKKK